MSAPAITTRPRAGDLYVQLRDGGLYRQAAQAGMSLSAWLEEQNPHEDYRDGLDGFSRFMRLAGIATRSDPAAGYYADTMEAFNKPEDPSAMALLPEWVMRQWRAVRFGSANPYGGQERLLHTNSDHAVGTIAHPYVDAAQLRMRQIQAAIPLSELVAVVTPITGDAYRAAYLTEPAAADIRLNRVQEGSEIPRAKLVSGENTVRLRKYGRAIEITYEALRRQRIDRVALWIAKVAVQAEVDKVATVIDIILNGDGNANTAATNYNLTTLDGAAVAGTMTLKGWLAFKLKFTNPYALTTTLTQDTGGLQLLLLNMGSANVPLVTIQAASGFGGFRPINPELSDNVGLGITSDAPSLKLVGLDRRWGIEQVTEVGADITEVERWATRQTQALVLSEVMGFAVFDQAALKTLNINA